MRTKTEILQGEPENIFATSCYFNIAKFAERVLGLTIKPFHKEWLDIFKKHDRIAIAAPTGFGKTEIFGVVIPIWYAFYKPKSLCLIISKTIRTQSAGILEEIKSTIEDNEFLNHLKPTSTDIIKSSWTKEKIITTNSSKILYSSYSINVRGIAPDYLFADEVATYPDHELFFRDVATRVVAKKGKLAAVSTPLNTTDLLAKLMNSKGYFKKFYPAIVNDKSIWPEKFSVESLLKEKARIGSSNFERNYMVNPKAEVEQALFPLKSIENCYDITKLLVYKYSGENQVFIGCDFAIATGPYSDFDCYVVVEKFGDILTIIWAEVNKTPSMAAKINRLKQLYEIYKPIRVVIDESQIGEAIIQDLRSQGLPVQPQSFHSAARSKLLNNLKGVIDGGKIIIPCNIDDSHTDFFKNKLTEELLGFKVNRSEKTQNVTYLSTASHDDTVMALAMAVSSALSQRSFEDYYEEVDKIEDLKENDIGPDDEVNYSEATIPESGSKVIRTW